jgi:carbon storage regulator
LIFSPRCKEIVKELRINLTTNRLGAISTGRDTGSDEASMLYLTRKIGDSVVINDNIEVTVVEVRGKSIKLGFDFPQEVTVLRRELYDKIQEENHAAANAVADLLGIAPEKTD